MIRPMVFAAAGTLLAVGAAAAQVSDKRYDPEMRQILTATAYGVVISDLPFDAFTAPPELIAQGKSKCATDRLSFSIAGGTMSQTLITNGTPETVVVSRLIKGSTVVATGYTVKYVSTLNRPDWVLVRYPSSGVLISSQSTPSGALTPSQPAYQAFVPCDAKP